MYIRSNWRILTIGDGDLTFSLSLVKKYQPARLVATVLDSESALRAKYTTHAIEELRESGNRVEFEVDITRPTSFDGRLKAEFDLIVFQFPLVPNQGAIKPGKSFHHTTDSNLLNRNLLANTLEHGFSRLLDKDGAQLCYITSKDVKPYCDWNIPSLGAHLNIPYLGECEFLPKGFPGYQLRNVDRDKRVKATAAVTYVWGKGADETLLSSLSAVTLEKQNYCPLCQVGPMLTEQDIQAHLVSRLHKRKEKYERQWIEYLEQI